MHCLRNWAEPDDIRAGIRHLGADRPSHRNRRQPLPLASVLCAERHADPDPMVFVCGARRLDRDHRPDRRGKRVSLAIMVRAAVDTAQGAAVRAGKPSRFSARSAHG